MAHLEGPMIGMRFERIDSNEWTDPKTNMTKTIRKFVGMCEYEKDGKRDWVEINFPRDPAYRAPQLKPKGYYLFPVSMYVDKKGGIRMSIRTDITPVEAPDLGELV